MSTHSEDHEDMLEKMERIAEEEGMHDEDDDSFNAEEFILGTGESMGPGSYCYDSLGSLAPGYDKKESMGSSLQSYDVQSDPMESQESLFTMDDEEDQWGNSRGSFDDSFASSRRRGSHASRRSSYRSTDSAATSSSRDSPQTAGQELSPRASSSKQFAQKRRSSFTHTMGTSRLTDGACTELHSPSPKIMKSMRQPFSRLSTRRLNAHRRSNDSGGSWNLRGNDGSAATSAFASVGLLGNSDLDNVAAAAAVVALGTGTAGSKRIQYAVDDTVLVFLNILNHTNSVDPPEAFTVAPVNKYGFQPGEGKRNREQEGPFIYVMATVRRVHFNEDIPYYTVVREDTLAEQRADAAWMEPLTSLQGIEAATRAARQTGRSAVTLEASMRESAGIAALLGWPVKFVQSTLVPMYHNVRTILKELVKHMLFGEAPFYCRLRVTGINLLVLGSFIYMFIQVVNLAFLPASWDYGVAVLGTIVWGFLALELILEWLIRPSNYHQLMASDKAYAPSTARHITSFHLIFESIALALFIPEFDCVGTGVCGKRIPFSGVSAALDAVLGPTKSKSAFGRFCIALNSLRIFGLVRHWKTMRINRTFSDDGGTQGWKPMLFVNVDRSTYTTSERRRKKKRESMIVYEKGRDETESKPSSEEDHGLKKAATTGTALIVVNSQRSLVLIVIISIFVPIITTISWGVNNAAIEMVNLLNVNNILLAEPNETNCAFLEDTIYSFLGLSAMVSNQIKMYDESTYLLWAQLLPVRCAFQNNSNGVITQCANDSSVDPGVCNVWSLNPEDPTPQYFAHELGIRVGGITEYISIAPNTTFSVRAVLNENHVIGYVNFSEFLLLVSILALTLLGLVTLRSDAGRLVLGPLQRMLKIVVRYAEKPLSQQSDQKKKRKQKKANAESGDDDSNSDADKGSDNIQLGNYETEQLISAIAKIADLLRKCWGVAGAGIISTNLARTEEGMTVMFNPTVPGKRVYALFGFVTIDGFSDMLRALDRDVMILINDVAKVVHDEVYRWALGDSGQCNKNLGSSFLMVFRIGDFTEVHERQARATDVVFSSEGGIRKAKTLRHRGRPVAPQGSCLGGGRHGLRRHRTDRRLHATTEDLTLASLPGIQTFTDRALIGLLKTFASLCREKSVQNWKKDFRLGAGVGAFDVSIMIGMDAGWAVEGAVGSEYKIDATYLSPHVNMASRMMSASKQYGVKLLMSQAVEELLSSNAREKLRHLDTVYVKGSSVAQRVFTYDVRQHGVDFFLFARSPEQSDMDAESYSPAIWDSDQDLRAMRQHVSEEFQRKFKDGVRSYLAGKWKTAISTLRRADDIMITTVFEEGYIDYNLDEEIDQRLRNELGDGACKCLISYMERRGGVPPKDWNGVRPLTSK